MKQLAFMLVAMSIGVIGPFAIEPFVGVAVYYLFAVLRPQHLWQWSLPAVGWSAYVAYATIAATGWWMLRGGPPPLNADGKRYIFAHKAFFVFAVWICVTYLTAQHPAVAWPWLIEYLKLFAMYVVAATVIREVRQIWWIYLVTTLVLIYIAYELNFLYLTAGRLDIYRHGYGGLDNNGAGLMMAMGIPLSIFAWEVTKKWWRWIFIAAVPVLIHAVLMLYSRGAMVSLVAVTPLLLLRTRRRRQFVFVFVALLATVPYLAGNEMRARFFTVNDYANDTTANLRFVSWSAAIAIANDYPIFGTGIRNANLYTYRYGADIEGRTIHSQYLQILADTGYPGLLFYLTALGSTWLSILRARWRLRRDRLPDADRVRSMLAGIEGALLVFCVGATFLSLEVFELPYIIALLGAQLVLLTRPQMATVPQPQHRPVTPPMLPRVPQRAS